MRVFVIYRCHTRYDFVACLLLMLMLPRHAIDLRRHTLIIYVFAAFEDFH